MIVQIYSQLPLLSTLPSRLVFSSPSIPTFSSTHNVGDPYLPDGDLSAQVQHPPVSLSRIRPEAGLLGSQTIHRLPGGMLAAVEDAAGRGRPPQGQVRPVTEVLVGDVRGNTLHHSLGKRGICKVDIHNKSLKIAN